MKPVVGGIANSFIPGLGNTITGAADAIGRGIDSLGGDRVKQSNPPPEVKRLGRRYWMKIILFSVPVLVLFVLLVLFVVLAFF